MHERETFRWRHISDSQSGDSLYWDLFTPQMGKFTLNYWEKITLSKQWLLDPEGKFHDWSDTWRVNHIMHVLKVVTNKLHKGPFFRLKYLSLMFENIANSNFMPLATNYLRLAGVILTDLTIHVFSKSLCSFVWDFLLPWEQFYSEIIECIRSQIYSA
jgi:hypothetical protein